MKKQKREKLIIEIMKADEELGLYSEVELVCIFESDKPTCNCELKHCLKKDIKQTN